MCATCNGNALKEMAGIRRYHNSCIVVINTELDYWNNAIVEWWTVILFVTQILHSILYYFNLRSYLPTHLHI